LVSEVASAPALVSALVSEVVLVLALALV